jgi:hypothetical protein
MESPCFEMAEPFSCGIQFVRLDIACPALFLLAPIVLPSRIPDRLLDGQLMRRFLHSLVSLKLKIRHAE